MCLPKSGKSGSSMRKKGKDSEFWNENGKKKGELRSEKSEKNDQLSDETTFLPGTKTATPLFLFLVQGTPTGREAALSPAK
jgi:hypothetical protein